MSNNDQEKGDSKEKTKLLRSLNFSLPIESEKWTIKNSDIEKDLEASHLVFMGNYNSIRIDDDGYSSTVGLGVGFVRSEVGAGGSSNLDFNGFDVNIRFGPGFAPITGDFMLAVHVLMGLDLKMIFSKTNESEGEEEAKKRDSYDVYETEYNMTFFTFDVFLGGGLVLAYQIKPNFGVMAGIDASCNMIGVGYWGAEVNATMKHMVDDEVVEKYSDSDSDKKFLMYYLTGPNIVPRIGVFFTF